MGRISAEEKLIAVKRRLEGGESFEAIGNSMGVHHERIREWCRKYLFFASLNSRKLQAKMANFASPFWRKLQAAQQGFLTRHEQHCRHAIEIISIAAFVPDDQRCFCKSC